ncbi:hypothetical protein B0F90DRAFT_1681188 [Multifurca ochricompacta]|uniref:Glycosyltransferase family 31 protein n=1 Tax=Multifurca ochricompacta TaxID=376703 RepID=A0AAD4MDW3_9AGAM|nr:hypothetical protein B0F90DRAFT_1681188 [Multifurca ochricompacta]
MTLGGSPRSSHPGPCDHPCPEPFENTPDPSVLLGSERLRQLPQSRASLSSNAQLGPAAQQNVTSRSSYVFPGITGLLSGRTSLNSSAMSTPLPSRSSSPLPQFYSSALSSASDTDSDDPVSPLLLDTYAIPYLGDVQPRWWQLRQRTHRRTRRSAGCRFRSIVRFLRRVFRHPFFPSILLPSYLLSLLFFSILALSTTFLLIHLLNPDKEPLPWRAYCTVPETSTDPPPLNAHPTFLNISTVASAPPMRPFPPSNFDSLPPVGVFVGVFSMDSASERRMLIRSTWASHPRSRNGAGDGDGGAGTSRTVVRFIMGQPRKTWERRIRVEMEEFNDIVLLPIPENMNSGKTHSFFTWAASMAWVPPLSFDTEIPLPTFSYSNASSPILFRARHDPVYAWRDRTSPSLPSQEWVRPDFVVKADDDSFIMLAELEARIRKETSYDSSSVTSAPISAMPSPPTPDWTSPSSSEVQRRSPPGGLLVEDPLIYWGYLVKRRFMAGELYALSWSLVDWLPKEPAVKGLVRGAEDKQTAKWMRLHPRSAEVRWVAEHCWVYDHPRSGTILARVFIPSEVAPFFDRQPAPSDVQTAMGQSWHDKDWGAPTEWARSSVSTFGTRYTPPLPDLTIPQSIEALVEGSDMSDLYEGTSSCLYFPRGVWSAEDAWHLREGRKKRQRRLREEQIRVGLAALSRAIAHPRRAQPQLNNNAAKHVPQVN